MQNTFAAGQDALLKFLADRDARQQLAEDRARRAEIDQQNEAYRQEQLRLQGRQIDETAGWRQAQLDSLKDTRDAASEQKRAAAELANQKAEAEKAVREQLEKDMLDPSLSKEQRLSAWYKLRNITPVADVQTGRDREAEAEARANRSFQNQLTLLDERDRRAQRDKEAKKDDPQLPTGTKDWIDTLANLPIEEARAQLQAGFKQQRAAHPNVDLAEASKYLDNLYTQESDIATGGKSFKPKFKAAPAAPAPTVGPPPELQAKAATVIATKLGRPATAEEVAKFLSSPQNVQALTTGGQ